MTADKEKYLELQERITDYLGSGGLFNPEMAKHDAVRDLLIECRDALARAAAVAKEARVEEAREWLSHRPGDGFYDRRRKEIEAGK